MPMQEANRAMIIRIKHWQCADPGHGSGEFRAGRAKVVLLCVGSALVASRSGFHCPRLSLLIRFLIDMNVSSVQSGSQLKD